MSILSVCQEVARRVGVDVPDSVYGSTEPSAINLGELANECAKEISFDLNHEWTYLKATGTITGDGSTEDWTLTTIASDYKKMQRDADLWPSNRPYDYLKHVNSYNRWLGWETQDFEPVDGIWTLHAGQLHIKPAITNAATVKFGYIKNTIGTESDLSTTVTIFDEDTDRFIITHDGDPDVSERLLRKRMIWQWKAQRERPHANDLTDYNIAEGEAIMRDKGPMVLSLSKRRRGRMRGVPIAYPGTISES